MKSFKHLLTMAGAAAALMTCCMGGKPAAKTPPAPQPAAAMLRTILDTLQEDMIYSVGTLKTTSSVMQSFDFDPACDLIYYTQLNNQYRIYVSWGRPDSSYTEGFMELHYFGHGSNFSIEAEGDKRYIWITNYASKGADDAYWQSQIVSRVPIEAGAVVKPWDTEENYYFGEKNIAVAADFANGLLSTLNISSGRMTTYRLDQMRALPVEEITLEPLIYGGAKSPDPLTNATLTVKARDCRRLTPVGEFTITRTKGISWQGFDICGDLIYQAQGNGNGTNYGTPSNGYVLIFKVDGTVVQPRTRVVALDNLRLLDSLGITDTGYMEPEGVKVRNGVMYCGYANKNSQNVRRATILKFSPAAVATPE